MDQHHRRLVAVSRAIGSLADRFKIPGSDMDCLVASTALGELHQALDLASAQAVFAAGHALGLVLVDLIGPAPESAADVAHFKQLPAAIEASSDPASAHELLLALRKALSSLVARSGYPADQSGQLQGVMASIFAWEADVYRSPDAPSTEDTQQLRDVRQILETSAREQDGMFSDARVIDVQRLVGGFANETTMFTLADGEGEMLDLVCRAETGLQLGIEGRDIGGEYHLLRYLHRGGLSVAEPIWLESDIERYGTRFFVTRKLAGSNFGTVVDAQRLGSAQLRELAIQLAKIHSLPLDAADADLTQSHIDTRLVTASTSTAMGDYLERWIRLWRSTALENSPTVEATLHWLRANLPANDAPPVLVHGDFALHNVMMDVNKIVGVLDWEMSHLGSRAEDLAGLFASFSDADQSREFMRHYLAAGGREVTEFELEYCNVFRYFGMYVVMLESQMRFYTLSGVHPELLVLGSYVQTPAQRMATAIDKAEQARIRA